RCRTVYAVQLNDRRRDEARSVDGQRKRRAARIDRARIDRGHYRQGVGRNGDRERQRVRCPAAGRRSEDRDYRIASIGDVRGRNRRGQLRAATEGGRTIRAVPTDDRIGDEVLPGHRQRERRAAGLRVVGRERREARYGASGLSDVERNRVRQPGPRRRAEDRDLRRTHVGDVGGGDLRG